MRIRSWQFPILLIALVLILAQPVRAQVEKILPYTGFGNSSVSNWPAGSWHIRAIILDDQGRPLGNLSGGFLFEATGGLYPVGVQVDMAGTVSPTDKIRVFRKVGSMVPGELVEYADFPCDDGSGGVLPRCSGTSQSLIDGVYGSGRLDNRAFAGTFYVPYPVNSGGLSSFSRSSEDSKNGRDWPIGDWNVRAVLLDGEIPVGELSAGFDFNAYGKNYPAGVEVSLLAKGYVTDKIRVYRKLGPILPGDTNVEYADFSCNDGSGNVEARCEPALILPIDNGLGYLPNDAFVGTADVPPSSRTGSPSINVTNSSNNPSWNWPSATSYSLAAILLDRMEQPLGDIGSTTKFTPTGYNYPLAEMNTSLDAASSDRIRIFRSGGQQVKSGDVLPYTDFYCNDGNGGVLAACKTGLASSLPPSTLRWNAFDLVGEVPQYNTPTAAPAATALSLRPTMTSFPNPADQRVSIRYALPRRGRVDLRVYDLAGRLVRQLSSETMDASEHVTVWDGRGQNGARVSAGVYMVRLSTPDGVATAKTLMLR